MLQMWPNLILNLSHFTQITLSEPTEIQSITLISLIRGMTERNPADSDDEHNINWLYINIKTQLSKVQNNVYMHMKLKVTLNNEEWIKTHSWITNKQ